jgi:hypothetical protein
MALLANLMCERKNIKVMGEGHALIARQIYPGKGRKQNIIK